MALEKWRKTDRMREGLDAFKEERERRAEIERLLKEREKLLGFIRQRHSLDADTMRYTNGEALEALDRLKRQFPLDPSDPGKIALEQKKPKAHPLVALYRRLVGGRKAGDGFHGEDDPGVGSEGGAAVSGVPSGGSPQGGEPDAGSRRRGRSHRRAGGDAEGES